MEKLYEKMFSNPADKVKKLIKIFFKVEVILIAVVDVISIIAGIASNGFAGFIGALVGCAIFTGISLLCIWIAYIMVILVLDCFDDIRKIRDNTTK